MNLRLASIALMMSKQIAWRIDRYALCSLLSSHIRGYDYQNRIRGDEKNRKPYPR
jgi:hypothetical protein